MRALKLLPLALSLLLAQPAGAASYLLGVSPNYSRASGDAPTSVSVAADGVTITINWPVAMSEGAGWSGSNLNVDGTDAGDNISPSWSGDGTATWTGTLTGSTILLGATADLDFDGTANSIEATSGGADLGEMVNFPIKNDSTQTGDVALVVDETFDPTGYDLSWSETVVTTVDEDFTGTGNFSGQSLQIVASGTGDRTAVSFTADAEGFCKFFYRRNANTGTTTIGYFASSGSARGQIRVSSSGGFAIAHGSTASANTTATLATSSSAVIWARYVQGTGADGVAELFWEPYVDGSSEVRGTSGANYTTSTATGTATTTVNQFYFGSQTTATQDGVFDRLKVSVEGYPN